MEGDRRGALARVPRRRIGLERSGGRCRTFSGGRVLASLLGGLLALLPGRAGSADIVVANTPVVAVRGGDLLVPLVGTDIEDSWPASLEVSIGDRTVEAELCWIVPRVVETERWTTPIAPVSIRQGGLARGETPPGNALALVRVPVDVEGEIRMLDRTWTPEWLDAMPPFDPRLELLDSLGRDADPPLDDPMEWFRWAVRGKLEGRRPPPPDLGVGPDAALANRVAIAIAMEWRLGIARIESSSPGVAAEICERLVATVEDARRPLGDRLVAAWPTDPRELAVLRGLLLDPTVSGFEAARAALAWFEARPPFIAWPVQELGQSVVLEIANPTTGEIVVLAGWNTSSDPMEAIVVPPRSLVEVDVSRPRIVGGGAPGSEVLELAADRRVRRIAFGPRAIPVRPPGAGFGPMAISLGLAAANAGFVAVPPVEESTSAILRRVGDTWQVFVEARTEDDGSSGDRIFLVLGESELPAATLEVASDGAWEVGTRLDTGGLDVRVHRFPDRWRVVVDLPESWLVSSIAESEAGAVLVGIRRDGPNGRVVFAGPPPPSWRRQIPTRPFAISDWSHAEDRDP